MVICQLVVHVLSPACERSFQLSINTVCVCVCVCMLYLRVSCNELSTESAMDRKNPCMAEQAYVTGDTSGGVGVSR